MCWALTDLLGRCPVANDPPFHWEERKGQTSPRQIVRGAVLMLPAEVTSRGVSSRAVARRSHTAGRSEIKDTERVWARREESLLH